MRFNRLVFLLAAAASTSAALWAASDVFFTDEARSIETRLVQEIRSVRRTLDGAVFDVTNPTLAEAILGAKERGVRLRFIVDARQAKGKHSQVRMLHAGGVHLKAARGRGGRGVMHHKFALFDGARLATGSYNWSRGAERDNYENIIFTDAPPFVASYQRAFDRLWRNVE